MRYYNWIELKLSPWSYEMKLDTARRFEMLSQMLSQGLITIEDFNNL